MPELFSVPLARIDRAQVLRANFAAIWEGFIETHPWVTRLEQVGASTFELHVDATTEPPLSLGLTFSDWLAALRSALDNGLYDWAIVDTGQNPPLGASSLQFPIASDPKDYERQKNRLKTLSPSISHDLEKCQPYQSPFGPESNLLYWLNELARLDRHRTLHFGLGRIATQRTRVRLPHGDTTFDTSVNSFVHIDGSAMVARFTTSVPLDADEIDYNPGIGIDPEIQEWSRFSLDGHLPPLWMRMTMMEAFMRNHVENMAASAGVIPPGGFQSFETPAHLRDHR